MILYHDQAATAPISEVVVTRGGVDTIYTYANGDYVSLHERGLLYFPENVLLPEDEWKIEGYDVYTGLVSELQAYIEGSTSRPVDYPGWRAAGTRVVVRPAETELLSMDVHVIPQNYVALGEIAVEVKDATIAFMRTLGPGDTFYTAQLIDTLMNNSKLISVRLYETGTANALNDAPAIHYRKSWRSTPALINIIPAQEE